MLQKPKVLCECYYYYNGANAAAASIHTTTTTATVIITFASSTATKAKATMINATAGTITASTKTEFIKAKISGNIELYGFKSKDTTPTQVVRGFTRNASGTVNGIKLKLSACVEEDVAETKGAMRMLLLLQWC